MKIVFSAESYVLPPSSETLPKASNGTLGSQEGWRENFDLKILVENLTENENRATDLLGNFQVDGCPLGRENPNSHRNRPVQSKSRDNLKTLLCQPGVHHTVTVADETKPQ